jgi:alpha-L-fucosidase 2
MDHQMIRDLFGNVIRPAAFSTWTLASARVDGNARSIAPNQIGKHGQLQEWLGVDSPTNQHRHVSHCGLVSWRRDHATDPRVFRKQLLSAATSERAEQGMEISLTRLLDGDHAHKLLLEALDRNTYPTCSTRIRRFRSTAPAERRVLQMLLHRTLAKSNSSCAKAWLQPVQGLRARGGFEVDIDWKRGPGVRYDSQFERQPMQVRYGAKSIDRNCPWQAAQLNARLEP